MGQPRLEIPPGKRRRTVGDGTAVNLHRADPTDELAAGAAGNYVVVSVSTLAGQRNGYAAQSCRDRKPQRGEREDALEPWAGRRCCGLPRAGSGVELKQRSRSCAPPQRFAHADRGFAGQGSLTRES
jgi:hypothetical protein